MPRLPPPFRQFRPARKCSKRDPDVIVEQGCQRCLRIDPWAITSIPMERMIAARDLTSSFSNWLASTFWAKLIELDAVHLKPAHMAKGVSLTPKVLRLTWQPRLRAAWAGLFPAGGNAAANSSPPMRAITASGMAWRTRVATPRSAEGRVDSLGNSLVQHVFEAATVQEARRRVMAGRHCKLQPALMLSVTSRMVPTRRPKVPGSGCRMHSVSTFRTLPS